MGKILFVAQSLKVGGIERALVEQVNSLSKTETVSIFLFTRGGAYIDEIDKRVNIIYGNWLLNCIGKTKKESKKNIITYFVRNAIALLVKILGREFIYKIIFSLTKTLKVYDVAISYVNDQGKYSLYSGCNQFLLYNVKSKIKIAWIHSDPRRLGLDQKYNIEMYNKMDYVVNVSHAMKIEFDKLKILPPEKSVCVYNRINKDVIFQKSKLAIPFKNRNNIIIITVGRLEELKGTKELLKIAKNMVEEKVNYTWYFLGDGVLKSFCETYINNNGLENNVILLGNIENPYPYIANADICVSGSKTETFGISIVEALLLKTPVIALHYTAINEIINETNGIVCSSYIEMQKKIKHYINNRYLLNSISDKTSLLMDYNAENSLQIKKILNN